ncbi:BamA/TamA family outer membrane protein [Pendulispora albinea]|uniref:BamA/TamA family outer membrane protein n=1 Tax=Pendulispora albinea TaxID=2741071 RepID=A0ABZ2LW33_9BACT
MKKLRASLAFAGAVLVATQGAARAGEQEATSKPPPPEGSAPSAGEKGGEGPGGKDRPWPASARWRSKKRALPDYDGRGDDPTTAGDVALWVPRVLLSPLYFTSEFLLRRPLGALIAGAERAGLPEALYNFFTFGPDHKAGVFPTAFADFGLRPSVGFLAFWRDAFVDGNELQVRGSIWTSDWLAGQVLDRITLRGKDTLTLQVSGLRRPDYIFHGIGPRSVHADRSRYGKDQIDAGAAIDLHLWRAIRLEAGIGMKSVEIYNGRFGGEPNISQGVDRGFFETPYGFDRGYTALYNHAMLALDTRKARPAPGSGIRIELQGDQGSDVRRTPGSGWVRYGGTVGGFYDLNGRGRVISLSVSTLFADPLGSAPIPFTELVSLGGPNAMRGYLPGRLVDRSATVVTARYRWPIWMWLDGSLQASVGNVFGEHLRDFKPSLLRFSGAVGVESVGTPDSSFELLMGMGSETFEHGGQINSFRFAVGSNRGF